MRPSIRILALVAALVAMPAGVAAAQQDARRDLEKMAAELEMFTITSVHGDDWPVLYGTEEFLKQTEPLRTANYAEKDLLDLLKHNNPRVRTLAAAALFARKGVKALPHLRPLANDKAASFFVPLRTANPVFSKFGPKKMLVASTEQRTVGQFVTRMFTTYLIPAGYHYGIAGKNQHPGFDDYWARRKDRQWCASWFYVEAFETCLGRSPTKQDRLDHFKKVRHRIEQLPEPDRTFVLLWLHEPGEDTLITDKELVERCKKVGPEKLVKVLQRKIPSADPDLQPRKSNNYFYAKMVRFILDHATELLRPQDADALLACERWERDYLKHGISDPMLSAGWFTAAAKLQPAKAKEILKLGWDRFPNGAGWHGDERARLALLWHRHGGEKETGFLVNWFYNESPKRGGHHGRSLFLQGLGAKPTAADRKLIAALIKDMRFDQLDWQSLRDLGLLVNSWETKPVIALDELFQTGHPLGIGQFHWEQQRAAADYPKETAALLQRLAQWRDTLGKYVATERDEKK